LGDGEGCDDGGGEGGERGQEFEAVDCGEIGAYCGGCQVLL
jgi:hypothetical protein